jgi:multicomponent K+:H+ antiporter subunit E
MSAMPRGLLPSPTMSLAVLAVWLLLSGLSPGSFVLGVVLAWGLPLFGQRLRAGRSRMRRPLVAARLGLVVLHDIVVSNLVVARLVLGPQRRLRPGFAWIPLDIRNPHGVAAFAGIITMTPGTVSSDLSADGRFLLVHFLDLDDADAAVRDIKQRYEVPLMEVFP